ncbi:MAG: iron-containing alcohol dehydrogenase [Clostridia bacterium]|nr:iron-containing alcohol dehydrogenase [Clostridia bacterium]
MNSFIYDIPTKVYFGKNQLENLVSELKTYKKVLLVYGGGSIKKSGLYDRVIKFINNAGLEVFELFGVEPNPEIGTVRRGVKIAKEKGVDVILAVGGGSVIDCAKWIAGGAKVEFDAWEFYSKNAPVLSALPIISILTLSATGSEMDSCGVVTNPETKEKVGKLAQPLYPKVSFLDPTLTYTVDRYQTACGSADILSHVIETYFSKDDDLFMLDTVMEGIMKTVVKYAPIALENPCDYEARANLMWASSWAINGFILGGKVKAWSCHPLEHQLTAYYGITHGLGLAILTPRWMKYCLSDKTVDKFVSFGVNVFDIDKSLSEMEIANKAIEMLSNFLYKTLGLSDTFEKVGIGSENISAMALGASKGRFIDGFVPLYKEDIETIYKMCL